MKKQNSTKQINRSYQSKMKALIKGKHEEEIFDSLKNGKNSYLRLDRLASSSFDKSWIETIEDVIFDLGAIIANPRSTTKVEGSITPVELAKKITGESVQHLASHTQYIKEVDEYGNVIPSKLLSMYADDDIHTYENRFIATFVRRLMLFITKRYEYITKYAELRNEEVLFFKNYSVVDGADVEIETKVKVSYKNETEEEVRNSKYIDRIIQTRQYILYFYNSPFMKALKTEKDVRNPIIQTNIIRKNPKYRHCYEVYRFIESYDKLGVNYKIDENYSLFKDEEINELNRTLFANYITLKGNSESKSSKKNTKVYKPRILTSLDDESFIYGPLFEGPIEFVRTDEGYQKYLDSKVRKDLPLHPTKKEKEYYSLEYEKKSENKEDLKQKNDLIKRTEKQVNQFEKKVKNILAKREEARLKLLELEAETIRQEEQDLLEAARREIIDASKEDKEQATPKVEEAKQEAPKQEEPVKEKIVYVPTVSFEDAAKEIWPQLYKPVKQVKKAKQEQPQPVEVEVIPQPVEAPVEEPQPVIEAEEAPKAEQKVYVPTVTFDEAADEIWPQLNNPNPIVKQEVPVEQVIEQPKAVKKAPIKKAAKAEPVEAPQIEEAKPAPKVYVPTVSFDDAADEIWPQLNNPQPIVVEKPVEEAPVVVEQAKEEKPAEVKEPTRMVKLPKGAVLVPIPEGRKIKKRFIRADGTEAIIWVKEKKAPANPEPIKEAPKKEEPKAPEVKKEEPKKVPEAKPEVKPQPKPLPKKEEKKENKPQQKTIKGKNSRKKFRK